jgi:molybdenum cofactor biosynthesis enzyme MoaA
MPDKRMTPPPITRGLAFSPVEVRRARDGGHLLRVTIELTESSCNLRCRYCWSDSGGSRAEVMSTEALCAIIRQAAACGVRTVVLTGGGEPLLKMGRLRCVGECCAGLGLWVVVFTNGTLVDGSIARVLKKGPFSIVAKMHALNDAGSADWLANRVGAHESMRAGIGSLLSAGLAEGVRLGCETVIVRRNRAEIPAMWRWLREAGIVPYFESPKRLGRARAMADEEFLSPAEVGELFGTLQTIDREEFGFEWVSRPPIAAIG